MRLLGRASLSLTTTPILGDRTPTTLILGDRTPNQHPNQRSHTTTSILKDRTPTSPNSDSYGALRYRTQP
ncbi:MAG: hypothetical protein V6D39_09065 [Dolichospermum lemmermannii FEM_B0920]